MWEETSNQVSVFVCTLQEHECERCQQQGFLQDFELGAGGGKHGGSRMIVVCESTLMHV